MLASRRGQSVILLSALLSGCGKQEPAAPAPEPVSTSKAVTGPAKEAVAPGSPCDFLADAAVRRVLPQAAAGVRDSSDDQYGITRCVWSMGVGQLSLQMFDAGLGAVDNEMQSRAFGLVNPRVANSVNTVRFETIQDVGDKALAVVEKTDARRGIVSGNAILVTQRGNRVAILMFPELANGKREDALQRLEALGRSLDAKL